MSLYKAILHKKEYRKQYGGKRGYWTFSCVNHNDRWRQCPWCKRGRLHNALRKLEQSSDLLREQMDEYKIICYALENKPK